MSVEVDQASKEKGFEQQDVNVRWVIYVGLGLLVALLICLGSIRLTLYLYHKSDPHPPLTALEKERVLPPEPRLETNPTRNGERITREAREQLTRTGWIDRARGIAHIPIAEAKAQLAQTGWPSRAERRPDEKPYPLSRQDSQGKAP
ncbi:hypothetical protein [Pseudomonas luteola]|uniref:Uncharacterized protein n=1 Tax=Pseudomonas luteola TaxID=47886 RepID=A0ABS0FTT1_PSELU|nr:hypothetical protein [Pseudomonas zeshuii]MBF8643758.1 hypothetical protein [Pseudomonas zeshuii]